MITRSRLRFWISAAVAGLAVTAVLLCPVEAGAQPLADSRAFLERVAADESAGQLTPAQALLYQFHYMFAPEALPDGYQVEGFSPLKCGTDLVRRYHKMKGRLDQETGQLIASYLEVEQDRQVYLSLEGHFQLNYSLAGEDAVPAQDTSPANGVPDFVERAGQYLEQAWTVQILMTGFSDPVPAGARYQVYFRDMQSYGYTFITDLNQGTTAIMLHSSFVGFPGNDDPDGDIAGAAKVTCAHELKHASQYTDSSWSEGGWIELDAVWAEELVFDLTNDYYNYLGGGSPIRHPEISLDGGSTGTGSYEDCVFQIWLQETWGASCLVDFWQRRQTHTTEPVMDTYAAVLQERGAYLDLQWGVFTAWNHATGYRAVPGLGYGEAAAYPYGPVVAEVGVYPEEVLGQVEHLAANVIRLLDFDPDLSGTLDVRFSGSSGQAPLTAVLVISRSDGTGVFEALDVVAEGESHLISSVPLQDIARAAVVVGNPDRSGTARSYSVTVERTLELPEPQLDLETTQAQLVLVTGSPAQTNVLLGNDGQEGSVLHFGATVWEEDPYPLLSVGEAARKSVTGSSLTADPATYRPGQDLAMALTLHNGSTDEEWLTDLELTLPAGVTMLEAGPFSGGSLGDLIWNGIAGPGVTTGWHGEYGSQGYGVIREGETATAQIQLGVAADFSGPLVLDGQITGDQFGDAPHIVSVPVVLQPQLPALEVIRPESGRLAAVGETLGVAWQQDGSLSAVAVSLSRDGGESWQDLAVVPADQDSFLWTVTGPASALACFRVADTAGQAAALSPETFTIYPASSWLTCEPVQGEIASGALAPVTLATGGADPGPGEYQLWLVVHHDGADEPAVVPVAIRVSEVAGSPALPVPCRLLGARPNPFNPATAIAFDLAGPRRVSVSVMDLKGRRVRELLDSELPAGRHSAAWDGRDDAGRSLPSGLYVARLRTHDYTGTVKLLLVR